MSNMTNNEVGGAGQVARPVAPTVIAGSDLVIANATDGAVVFAGETAGYKNAVGMYTIGADGAISNVQIVFANASLKGSGGDLIANVSSADVGLGEGQKVGFFIVPNGFAVSDTNAKLLSDTAGTFKLVTASGEPGNVNGGVELKLVHVSVDGTETTVKSTYGTSLFHSVDGGSLGLNGDGINHVRTTANPADGMVTLAFEDLKGGGDKDFDDSRITFKVGVENATLLAEGRVEEVLKARAEAKAEKLLLEVVDLADVATGDLLVGDASNDVLTGGKGSDALYGLDGNDRLVGDRVGTVTADLKINVALVNALDSGAWKVTVSNLPDGATLSAGVRNDDGTWTLEPGDLEGLSVTAPDAADFALKITAAATDGSGLVQSDELSVSLAKGDRNDLLVGGKGNDVALGGAGDDVIYGGSIPTGEVKPHVPTYEDNDILRGGAGNDVIFGNTGDDKIWGGVGSDKLSGGKGNDWLSDGKGSDHVKGNTGDDHVVAGLGDDVYEGNAGFDTLDFSRAAGSMSIDMSKKTAAGQGVDTFSGFERVVGSNHDDKIKGSKRDDAIDGGDGNDVIRGLGGADSLTGGAGRDTFTFTKKDAADGTVDRITDFSTEDVLDMSDFFKGQKVPADQVVAIRDDGITSHVYAKIGADMVEVAVLENFSGHTTAELLKAGMILA